MKMFKGMFTALGVIAVAVISDALGKWFIPESYTELLSSAGGAADYVSEWLSQYAIPNWQVLLLGLGCYAMGLGISYYCFGTIQEPKPDAENADIVATSPSPFVPTSLQARLLKLLWDAPAGQRFLIRELSNRLGEHSNNVAQALDGLREQRYVLRSKNYSSGMQYFLAEEGRRYCASEWGHLSANNSGNY
jgi:hypothetical protein